MKLSKYFIIVILLLTSCVTTEELMKQKFSPAKKYAVIPFECVDNQYGVELSKKVKYWLEQYDFNIIEEEDFKKNLVHAGITVEEIQKNYNKMLGKFKSVDAILIGYIKIDKTSSVTGTGASIGSRSKYTDRCDVMVVDAINGEVIAKTRYVSDNEAVFSWKDNIDEVAKKIVFQLLPH